MPRETTITKAHVNSCEGKFIGELPDTISLFMLLYIGCTLRWG